MTAPAFVHRVCDVTGLKVERKAEVLTRINAVVSIVALLIGAVAAVLLVLTRWQAVHLLPAEWYYRVLGVHGMSMLIFFIIFFEMAVLHFTSTALINARCAAPKTSWFAFALMLVGAVMVEYLMWAGKADVLFTSYVPLRADSNFYLGVILFAVGALTVVGVFFANLVVAKRERTYEGSLPLVVYGAVTAAIIAVITLLHGAIIYVPTWLWSIGVIKSVDPEVYRVIWWALGHSSQQINVAAMVAIWYMMGALTIGAVVLNEKISRSAFVLYVLFISMASAHHLLVDPGWYPAGWKNPGPMRSRRQAIELVEWLADYGVGWCEDFIHPERFDEYAHVRAVSPTPIAAGEQVATIWDFERFIGEGCVDVIQPDLSRCGGITVAKRVAEMSEQAGIDLVPHSWLTHLLTGYSLQLISTLPRARFVEFDLDTGQDGSGSGAYAKQMTDEQIQYVAEQVRKFF